MKVSPKDKDINPDLDEQSCNSNTARKVSKYGVISSPYFPVFARHLDRIRRDTSYLSVFSPNAGKYGPEITLYLDTFHAV